MHPNFERMRDHDGIYPGGWIGIPDASVVETMFSLPFDHVAGQSVVRLSGWWVGPLRRAWFAIPAGGGSLCEGSGPEGPG